MTTSRSSTCAATKHGWAPPRTRLTARFDEGGLAFALRTVPAQFLSAWRLEEKRLGDGGMRWYDRRMLGHRMLHGIVAE